MVSRTARPLQRTSLVDSAVGELRAFITQSRLQSGDKLPTEPELMERLGVSRTVLREAVSRLQMLGLLDVRAGRGTTVGNPDTLAASAELFRTALMISSADLLQFNELRTGLECQAVRLAAGRAGENDIAELERIFESMFSTRDHAEYVARDCAFHLCIASISGNVILLRLFELLQDLVLRTIDETSATSTNTELGRRLHRDIIQALKKGDAEAADAAMRRHMAVNENQLAGTRTAQKRAPAARV